MKCDDPVKSTLEVTNRGSIHVDAESVYRLWHLPNSGLKVCYEMKIELMRAFNEEYRFPRTNAPHLTAWCKMIRYMNGVADHRFLRAWSVVAFNFYLAPTTELKVSPRCYLAIKSVATHKNLSIHSRPDKVSVQCAGKQKICPMLCVSPNGKEAALYSFF
jgi:hypothetical protein